MRDKRLFNRVREAAALIKSAQFYGWRREVSRAEQVASDGKALFISVCLENASCRIWVWFWHRPAGNYSVTYISRLLGGRAKRRKTGINWAKGRLYSFSTGGRPA